MPNNYNAGLEILKGLFALDPRFKGQEIKKGVNMMAASTPLGVLSRLLGQTSAQPAQQQLKQAQTGTQTDFGGGEGVGVGLDVTDMRIKSAEKLIKKQIDAEAEQALPQLGPEGLAESANKMMIQKQLGEPDVVGGDVSQNIIRGLLAATEAYGQMSPGSLQMGYEKQRQELEGKQPLQEGRSQELGIMHQNHMQEIMATQGINEEQATSEIFKSDIQSLVNNYNKVNLKGTLGNLVGAPAGFVGIDREDRKAFESSADSLVYSVASYIAGQEGRALSDRDIQLVNKWAKFNLKDRTQDFRGKLRNLIEKANSRLKIKGGTLLPSIDNILGKGKASQPNLSVPKVTGFEIIEE